ncbi:class I SAM-dependent methyltransferase [Azospirillum rugosum]|uniref:SAM-dependent methyltransferase n=1 Tax=Azospirillum rugosum TaxID=416170 RepID=A0ABS4SGM3_9PROT|nr:class I SAM-dependent methyltransferase [Azospirillum rugosum]MBP2291349.1 SAM-dependent methyltransferase [Azospirillum rugosum]MDQ0525137.1 SAM-dependent methyltransferase [Azospirillum rugosum]
MPENDLSRYARLDDFLRKIRKDVYPEPQHPMHTTITQRMIDHLFGKYPEANGRILDVGCGQGAALEEFRKRGAQPVGIALGEDCEICRANGFDVHEMDQSFLDFPDRSFDTVWCRHALEHSVLPHFTLHGFHRVLRPGGYLYVEVPAPDTACRHQENQNHYSVMGPSMWVELIKRNGFALLDAISIDFETGMGPDVYHSFIAQKMRDPE